MCFSEAQALFRDDREFARRLKKRVCQARSFLNAQICQLYKWPEDKESAKRRTRGRHFIPTALTAFSFEFNWNAFITFQNQKKERKNLGGGIF